MRENFSIAGGRTVGGYRQAVSRESGPPEKPGGQMVGYKPGSQNIEWYASGS